MALLKVSWCAPYTDGTSVWLTMPYFASTLRSAALSVVNVPVTPMTCWYCLGISAYEKLPHCRVILIACHDAPEEPTQARDNTATYHGGTMTPSSSNGTSRRTSSTHK